MHRSRANNIENPLIKDESRSRQCVDSISSDLFLIFAQGYKNYKREVFTRSLTLTLVRTFNLERINLSYMKLKLY